MRGKPTITTLEGESMAQKTYANRFIECSAKTNIRIKDTVEEALRAAVSGPLQRGKDESSGNLCSCCQSWSSINCFSYFYTLFFAPNKSLFMSKWIADFFSFNHHAFHIARAAFVNRFSFTKSIKEVKMSKTEICQKFFCVCAMIFLTELLTWRKYSIYLPLKWGFKALKYLTNAPLSTASSKTSHFPFIFSCHMSISLTF